MKKRVHLVGMELRLGHQTDNLATLVNLKSQVKYPAILFALKYKLEVKILKKNYFCKNARNK